MLVSVSSPLVHILVIGEKHALSDDFQVAVSSDPSVGGASEQPPWFATDEFMWLSRHQSAYELIRRQRRPAAGRQRKKVQEEGRNRRPQADLSGRNNVRVRSRALTSIWVLTWNIPVPAVSVAETANGRGGKWWAAPP